MTFSQFTAHFLANKASIPASAAASIRREAIARVQERFQDGRGNCVLDFSDLVQKIEKAVAP